MAEHSRTLHYDRETQTSGVRLYTTQGDVTNPTVFTAASTSYAGTLSTTAADDITPALRLMDGNTTVYAELGETTGTTGGLMVSLNGKNYVAFPAKGKTLNEYTWDEISLISRAGKAAEYFNVGDTKEVILNGNTTNASKSFNNYSCYATILGFDHNASLETNGEHSIHFILGKNSTEDICFYPYRMNESYTTSGGWNGSKMKQTTMTEFKNCLPAELRAVLRNVTKYTHNTTGGSANATAANVTATTEQLFLLSEFEVWGAISRANSYEQNKQAQYAYYKNGNSKLRYNDTDGSVSSWWQRSASCYNTDTAYFCFVNSGGYATNDSATSHSGVAPAFVV